MNISKDIDVMAKKVQMQKCKELEAKTKRTKVDVKITKKKLVKERNTIVESFLNFNNEVSLPPLEEKLYTMLKVAPKNDQWLVYFTKAKQYVPNSTMFFSIFSPFFHTSFDKIFFFQVT
jgi:hypothetical protein